MKELTRKATDGNCLVSTLNGKFDEKQYCNTVTVIEKENVTFATVKRIRVLFDFNDSTFSPLAPGRAQGTKYPKG